MLRLLIVLSLGGLGCRADCNLCSSTTGIACISDSKFQFCDKSNKPSDAALSCLPGEYCTGATPICSEKEEKKSCTDCKKCSSDLVFACLSSNTFALCLGTTDYTTFNLTGSCSPNQVCNIKNPILCSPETTELPPTCPIKPEPEPINPTDYTPKQYCGIIKQTGRFPYGILPESTCRQYVSCYQWLEVWHGSLYTCGGNDYFDSATKSCIADMPPRCNSGVAHLRLSNLLII